MRPVDSRNASTPGVMALKRVFSKTGTFSPMAAFTGSTVGPRPRGYCSVTTAGISSVSAMRSRIAELVMSFS